MVCEYFALQKKKAFWDIENIHSSFQINGDIPAFSAVIQNGKSSSWTQSQNKSIWDLIFPKHLRFDLPQYFPFSSLFPDGKRGNIPKAENQTIKTFFDLVCFKSSFVTVLHS